MKRGAFRDRFELIRAIARAPMRTVRHRSIRDASGNTWRQLDELSQQGVLVRLAHGVCTAPPDGRDGRTRTPGLEAAGLALATARYGDRRVALRGIGAARFHGAIPRALGSTTVAVPLQGIRPVRLATGTMHFVGREMERLDVTPESTELGTGFVTTPEQTVFDLLQRPPGRRRGGGAAGSAPAGPEGRSRGARGPRRRRPACTSGDPSSSRSAGWCSSEAPRRHARICPDLRHSEDIDLICTSDRASTAARIEEAIRRGLRRSIGRTTFTPSLTELRRGRPHRSRHRRRPHPVPAAVRRRTSLVADRDQHSAPTLCGRARGQSPHPHRECVRRHGPHTRVTDADVARPVTQDLRMSSLGHQCRPPVSAEEALKVVESAWRSAAHE